MRATRPPSHSGEHLSTMTKIALDYDVLEAFLQPAEGVRTFEAVTELVKRGATLWVLPAVLEQLSAEGGEWPQLWRELPLREQPLDDFLKGCATGMARRYLDYHPDPRDCRLVAEAECAKMDALLTLSKELISGMGRRAENIRIQEPWDAVASIRRPTDQ